MQIKSPQSFQSQIHEMLIAKDKTRSHVFHGWVMGDWRRTCRCYPVSKSRKCQPGIQPHELAIKWTRAVIYKLNQLGELTKWLWHPFQPSFSSSFTLLLVYSDLNCSSRRGKRRINIPNNRYHAYNLLISLRPSRDHEVTLSVESPVHHHHHPQGPTLSVYLV